MQTVALERKLLKVALDEFLNHGYAGASLTRIVQHAGISKTTLYSRYRSRKELFRAMLNEQIKRSRPSEPLRGGPQPLPLEEGLVRYADDMLKFALKKELQGVERLLCSESHRFPELAEAARERSQLGVDRISRFISECAERDGIPCRNPASIAGVFIALMRGWYMDIVETGRRVTAAERKDWVRSAVHALIAGRRDW